MQLQARRFVLPHQLMVVSRDDNRCAKSVEFNKQAQEAACHLRVDVSCRLVGKQQFGLSNNRARNGSTLFFTA